LHELERVDRLMLQQPTGACLVRGGIGGFRLWSEPARQVAAQNRLLLTSCPAQQHEGENHLTPLPFSRAPAADESRGRGTHLWVAGASTYRPAPAHASPQQPSGAKNLVPHSGVLCQSVLRAPLIAESDVGLYSLNTRSLSVVKNRSSTWRRLGDSSRLDSLLAPVAGS